MSVPIIQGPGVLLRPIEERDMDARISLGRDADFVRMCGGSTVDFDPVFTRERAGNWYRHALSEPCMWIIEVKGLLVGSARFHSIDMADKRARYAIGIFDPAVRGKGVGTEATRLALRHAFEILGLHRVDLRVLEYNHRGIACYDKCGFVREGLEREGALIDGEWYSDIMMGILEPEYRELKGSWPELG